MPISGQLLAKLFVNSLISEIYTDRCKDSANYWSNQRSYSYILEKLQALKDAFRSESVLLLDQKDIKAFNTERYKEVLSFYVFIILSISSNALGLCFKRYHLNYPKQSGDSSLIYPMIWMLNLKRN